jgi:hypothetical protein
MDDSVSGYGVSDCAASPEERVAVAIPVKNEEERLPACLRALAYQIDKFGRPLPPQTTRVIAFATTATTTAPILLDH